MSAPRSDRADTRHYLRGSGRDLNARECSAEYRFSPYSGLQVLVVPFRVAKSRILDEATSTMTDEDSAPTMSAVHRSAFRLASSDNCPCLLLL